MVNWIGVSLGVEGLKVNIVFDGSVYEENIQGDMCSLIDAADNAIIGSSKPFSSISVVPEHWSLYLKDTAIPVLDCAKNDELLLSLNLQDGDYVYLLRNESAYLDPLYAAEYIKTFAKRFAEHIRPPHPHPSSTKKTKSKSRTKHKKIKPAKADNDVLLHTVGAIAKSLISGGLVEAFGLNEIGKSDASTLNSNDSENDKKNKDHIGQMQLLAGLLSAFSNANQDDKPKEYNDTPKEEF